MISRTPQNNTSNKTPGTTLIYLIQWWVPLTFWLYCSTLGVKLTLMNFHKCHHDTVVIVSKWYTGCWKLNTTMNTNTYLKTLYYSIVDKITLSHDVTINCTCRLMYVTTYTHWISHNAVQILYSSIIAVTHLETPEVLYVTQTCFSTHLDVLFWNMQLRTLKMLSLLCIHIPYSRFFLRGPISAKHQFLCPAVISAIIISTSPFIH